MAIPDVLLRQYHKYFNFFWIDFKDAVSVWGTSRGSDVYFSCDEGKKINLVALTLSMYGNGG